MALSKTASKNFDTLLLAAENGDLALVEVRERATGKVREAVCAIGFDGEQYAITPFAILIDGNPFELYDPPDPEGGFFDNPWPPDAGDDLEWKAV